jgi:pyruvate/2-oxoacid:ferredoxin oxidoreductase beta subunit
LEDWQVYGKSNYNIVIDESFNYVEEVKEVIDIELEEYKNRKIQEQEERTKNKIKDKYSIEEQLEINRELWSLQDKYNST